MHEGDTFLLQCRQISSYVLHLFMLPRPSDHHHIVRHNLPSNLLPSIRVELPVILTLESMHTLQHPPNTLFRQKHRPLTPHPRLNPPRIHANHHHPLQLLPHMPALLHRKRIQRRLTDRISRTPSRVDRQRKAHRRQARRHVHDSSRRREEVCFEEELGCFGRADDVDADVVVEVVVVN